MNRIEISNFLIISLLSTVQVRVFRAKDFFAVFFIFRPFDPDPWTMDPHIFADPDPGNQYDADPTDPETA